MEENKTTPTAEGEAVTPETAGPDMSGPEPALTTSEAVMLEHEGQAALFEMGEFLPDPGDVVVPFETIDELMADRRAAARDAVEQDESPTPLGADAPGQTEKPDDREPWEKTSAELEAEQKKPRRGRPPKEDKAGPATDKKVGKEKGAAVPRKGRPPKADKAAPGEGQPSQP